ncbi:uncharacterized protein V1516DRAFT_670345 [Lipomyces oligophaga]|uniref:uncharacterized protein n=1 Tax=Lipomyces oligophaga TaxID=45792 RepID=UPI0034CFA2F8
MSFFKWRGGASNSSTSGSSVSSGSPQKVNGSISATSYVTVDGSSAVSSSLESLPDQGDGSDKFFGMENFGYTCYCNSVLQSLFYCRPFREAVINYPPEESRKLRPRRTSVPGDTQHPFLSALKAQADREAQEKAEKADEKKKGSTKLKRGTSVMSAFSSSSTISSQTTSTNTNTTVQTLAGGAANGTSSVGSSLPLKGDDSTTPEQKKKAALTNGPIINMDHSMNSTYGMEESLFTTLKDIFEAMVENRSRIGVVSPSKLIEVLKRNNELFRSSMHQDAHEFFNFLLNEVVDNVERHDRSLKNVQNGKYVNNTTWVHELFEGLLTSETKCLTCENISRRDEVFLDLSIDLEQHSSVTSCLRQFSASEILCESNKFHCDCCGGLQEAEKRMKIKKLPRILALHLKRFKFTEDMQRNVKLFHTVVYPYHLRLFNTTDDVEDPDRLYELYSVIVHIGGGPYHGHYVSIVKTEHAGWVLYDDELVERVDDEYVTNFFGDMPGLACAYILFYQQISEEDYEQARRYGSIPQASSAVLHENGIKISNPTSNHSREIMADSDIAMATASLSSTTAPSMLSTSSASSTNSIGAHSPLPVGSVPISEPMRKGPSTNSSSTGGSTDGQKSLANTPPPTVRRPSSAQISSPTSQLSSTMTRQSSISEIGSLKGKKEGNSSGLSRFRSTSVSQKQKFWKRDKDKDQK